MPALGQRVVSSSDGQTFWIGALNYLAPIFTSGIRGNLVGLVYRWGATKVLSKGPKTLSHALMDPPTKYTLHLASTTLAFCWVLLLPIG